MGNEIKELWKQHDKLFEEYDKFPQGKLRDWWKTEEPEKSEGEIGKHHQAILDCRKKLNALQRNFEKDLEKVIGEEIRKDRELAVEVYGSLSNVTWEYTDGSRYSCSWRSAGGTVAEIRDCGEDYLDFYCSGNEGQVSEKLEDALQSVGWTPKHD